ncbi:MAG: hypothetical protein KDH20_10230 [Rhodocyclaceae bacterium]|nr:hypothetical protein [Rhodocyclaceae bacterium]
MSLRHRFGVLALTVSGLWMPVAAVAQPTAADVARASDQTRQIEARFVEEVAAAVGLSEAEVRALLPEGPRIADQGRRLVQAIGKRHRALTAEEQLAVLEADRQRRQALSASRH